MINKWHKVILIKEIDYDQIPSSIVETVKAVDNTYNVLDYEDLFVALDIDFDSILDELDQVEEEGRQNYIYQLFVDALPKKQEVKHIEKAMAKFDLWNYLASTLNANHDIKEYSKSLDNEFIEETLDEWKKEKISRLVMKREWLEQQREQRRLELLAKRKEKEISAEEEEELEYIEEEIEEYGGLFQQGFENINFGDESGFNSEDVGMSTIDLEGDFSDFAPDFANDESGMNINEPKDDFGLENTEVIEETRTTTETASQNKEVVEERHSDSSTNKNAPRESEQKVKVEKVEVIKEVVDPKLIKRLEDKDLEITNLLTTNSDKLQKEKERSIKALEDKQAEIEELKQRHSAEFNDLSEANEEQVNELKSEIEKRESSIEELSSVINDYERKQKEQEEVQKNLITASTLDELVGMKKKALRDLCDKLTITFSKYDSKEKLINKLMKKAERLNRVYNAIDIDEEVERRLEASKAKEAVAEELGLDPFKDLSMDNSGDSLFGASNDPFANFEQGGGAEDLFGAGSDPFANIDASGGMDDMFGGGSDPFANVDTTGGMDDMFGGGSDPFANISTSEGMDSAFSQGNDPFANMSMATAGVDDAFASGDDPFSNVSNNSTVNSFTEELSTQPNIDTRGDMTESLSGINDEKDAEEIVDEVIENQNKKRGIFFFRNKKDAEKPITLEETEEEVTEEIIEENFEDNDEQNQNEFETSDDIQNDTESTESNITSNEENDHQDENVEDENKVNDKPKKIKRKF